MNIRLHIERLVLEGLTVPRHQCALMQAAVEQELGRLLSAEQSNPHFASGGAMPAIQGGMIQGASAMGPEQLGAQIAAAVHSGIGDRR